MNPYSCHSCAKPSSSTMLDRFQLGFSPDIKLLPPHHNACHFVGSTEMDILRRFANIAKLLQTASSSSSQSMLGLAPTLPWIRSKQAGRQIQKFNSTNPKLISGKSKVRTEEIQTRSVIKKSVPPLAGEILEWQKRVFTPGGCCHFPTISPTMKP